MYISNFKTTQIVFFCLPRGVLVPNFFLVPTPVRRSDLQKISLPKEVTIEKIGSKQEASWKRCNLEEAMINEFESFVATMAYLTGT